MIYAKVKDLLKEVTGLDAAAIGTGAIERAMQTRAAACAIDVGNYLERLRSSPVELQALIDAVVVPETWFFRDSQAFTALGRIVREEWLPAHPQGRLRLLSLPCSSGEEPYSMAMALLDADVPVDRFSVDAIDVSLPALERCERGVYGKNSFRGTNLLFRERHFESTALGERVHDRVRSQVRFLHGNLFSIDAVVGADVYDVVFCRNLLIYFDDATQQRAVKVLEHLLAPQGVLFVAPSETGLLLNHAFRALKLPLAFAFRKMPIGNSAAATAEAARIRSKPQQPSQLSRAARPKRSVPAGHNPGKLAAERGAVVSTVSAAASRPTPEQALAAVSTLADRGQLAEAAQSCEDYLREHGPSVEAFHLMGLICAAVGNVARAHECYRKALYLDQSHQDTLLHLSLLLDEQGDAAGAQVLRSRLSRLDSKGAK